MTVLFGYSQQSNMLNAARLRVLKSREDHVASLLEDAKRRLNEITKDDTAYKQLLATLSLQGLFQVSRVLMILTVKLTFEL